MKCSLIIFAVGTLLLGNFSPAATIRCYECYRDSCYVDTPDQTVCDDEVTMCKWEYLQYQDHPLLPRKSCGEYNLQKTPGCEETSPGQGKVCYCDHADLCNKERFYPLETRFAMDQSSGGIGLASLALPSLILGILLGNFIYNN